MANYGTQDQSASITPLYSTAGNQPVSNTTARMASLNSSGINYLGVPANYGYANRHLILDTYGTYQTPTAPGSVLVEVTMGSTVISSCAVAASVLATTSTTREIIGHANIAYVDANTVRCNGWMEFEIAAGTTRLTFSSAASAASPAPAATATVAGGTQLPIQVYQTWSNAQVGQGTNISQVSLLGVN